MSSPRGDLVITAPVNFGRLHVVPVVAEFLVEYPEININLVLTDRVVHLMDEHADVAIRIGELPDSTLIATRLGSVRRARIRKPLLLASSRGAGHTPRPHRASCITFDVLASMPAWAFRSGKTEVSIPVRSRLSINTRGGGNCGAATLGVGLIRVLSYQVIDALRRGLSVVLEGFESAPLPVSLVHKEKAPLPRS